jgi:hypothetical protein
METSNNSYPDTVQNEQQSKTFGCFNIIIFFAILFWIIFVSYTRHISIYFFTINPSPTIRTPNFISALIQIFLIGLPLIPLSIFWPDSTFKNIFRSWLIAWSSIILFLPTIFIDPSAAQSYSLFHIILIILFILALQLFLGKKINTQRNDLVVSENPNFRSNLHLWLYAFFIGITTGLPWLYFGAFGSFTDTLLQITFFYFIWGNSFTYYQ